MDQLALAWPGRDSPPHKGRIRSLSERVLNVKRAYDHGDRLTGEAGARTNSSRLEDAVQRMFAERCDDRLTLDCDQLAQAFVKTSRVRQRARRREHGLY